MGAGYTLHCNACNYSVETSGPWEFYRDENGRCHEYGHPVPVSEAAAERGVYGFFGKLYCSTCDKVVDVILVEFKEPCRDHYLIWLGDHEPQEKYLDEDAVRCPVCENRFLILEPDNDHAPSCPRCGKGVLIGGMEWVS